MLSSSIQRIRTRRSTKRLSPTSLSPTHPSLAPHLISSSTCATTSSGISSSRIWIVPARAGSGSSFACATRSASSGRTSNIASNARPARKPHSSLRLQVGPRPRNPLAGRQSALHGAFWGSRVSARNPSLSSVLARSEKRSKQRRSASGWRSTTASRTPHLVSRSPRALRERG